MCSFVTESRLRYWYIKSRQRGEKSLSKSKFSGKPEAQDHSKTRKLGISRALDEILLPKKKKTNSTAVSCFEKAVEWLIQWHQ